MKGVKSVCSFTKSVFTKSSSTSPKRVFSANSQSDNQQPPTPDVDEDLVGPFIYPSNLGHHGNAFNEKTEEEEEDDDEGSKKSEDDDIPKEKDGSIYAYGPGFYQRFGPFRGSPVHLPKYPSIGYVSGGEPVRQGNHEGVCNGCPGCAGCSRCGCFGCQGCSGGYRNCPGCGRSGGS